MKTALTMGAALMLAGTGYAFAEGEGANKTAAPAATAAPVTAGVASASASKEVKQEKVAKSQDIRHAKKRQKKVN